MAAGGCAASTDKTDTASSLFNQRTDRAQMVASGHDVHSSVIALAQTGVPVGRFIRTPLFRSALVWPDQGYGPPEAVRYSNKPPICFWRKRPVG